MPAKAKPARVADEMLRIRVTREEKHAVEARADARGLSVAAFFRQAVGLPVRARGGAMPGAGRPRTEHREKGSN